MLRSGYIIILCLALIMGMAVPVIAQGPGRFVSDDGLFSFDYPSTWVIFDSGFSASIIDPDPATPNTETARMHVDVIYPGSGGISPGSYAGYTPDTVLAEFQAALQGQYVFTSTQVATVGGKSIALTSTTGVGRYGRLVTILLIAADVGGNHIVLVYAEIASIEVQAYQQQLLTLVGSMSYTGPAASAPVDDPPVVIDSGTPSPPVTPSATADQPTNIRTQATDFGRVVVQYGDGSLLIYNNSDQTVNIDGLVLESPLGDQRFTSNDFGGTTKNFFNPDRCIIVHLNTQVVDVPSFCAPGRTRILTYLAGDSVERQMVWNPGFATAGAFVVTQHGETVATCTIADGECAFDAPVVVFPFEQH